MFNVTSPVSPSSAFILRFEAKLNFLQAIESEVKKNIPSDLLGTIPIKCCVMRRLYSDVKNTGLELDTIVRGFYFCCLISVF